LQSLEQVWKMKSNPGQVHDWRYVLPCAFFDGENKFLSEMQGWQKMMCRDISAEGCNDWVRNSVGSLPAEKKWASEKIFYHEESNVMVMTFDILDQGIAYMIWWLRGNTERLHGSAIKIGDHWRVLGENEKLLKDFDFKEAAGKTEVSAVCLKIIGPGSDEILSRTLIFR